MNLVRVLCPVYCVNNEPVLMLLFMIIQDSHQRFTSKLGCSRCHGGVVHRSALYFDPHLRTSRWTGRDMGLQASDWGKPYLDWRCCISLYPCGNCVWAILCRDVSLRQQRETYIRQAKGRSIYISRRCFKNDHGNSKTSNKLTIMKRSFLPAVYEAYNSTRRVSSPR